MVLLFEFSVKAPYSNHQVNSMQEKTPPNVSLPVPSALNVRRWTLPSAITKTISLYANALTVDFMKRLVMTKNKKINQSRRLLRSKSYRGIAKRSDGELT